MFGENPWGTNGEVCRPLRVENFWMVNEHVDGRDGAAAVAAYPRDVLDVEMAEERQDDFWIDRHHSISHLLPSP